MKKRRRKNKKIVNIDEQSTKNVKIKKIIEKKFSKKKINSDMIMFEDINVRKLNVQTFIMFYINDTTSFANIFISKSLLEFENSLEN